MPTRTRQKKRPATELQPSDERRLSLCQQLIDYGARKATMVPAHEGLMATCVGGLIAGFSRCDELGDLATLLNAAARQLEPCRMMAREALDVFAEIARDHEELTELDDPLPAIAGVIVDHPKLQHLRQLFHVLPHSAAPLGAAVGLLVALTICRHLPRLAVLAERIVQTQPQ